MQNLVECYTSDEYNSEAKDGLIKTIILSGNGIFEKRKSWLGTIIKKESDYNIPIFPKLSQSINLTYKPKQKIPSKALYTVLAWYKYISDTTGKEAQVNFYLCTRVGNGKTLTYTDSNGEEKTKNLTDIKGLTFWNDEIFSYTPYQENSCAHTQAIDPIYKALNSQYGMFLETHSHNVMPAFCSQTDYENSLNDGLQLVFGTFNKDYIEMYNWITIRELLLESFSIEIINDYIEIPEYLYDQEKDRIYLNQNLLINIDKKIIDEWTEKIK